MYSVERKDSKMDVWVALKSTTAPLTVNVYFITFNYKTLAWTVLNVPCKQP